jgi:3-(3-hydroxy-phenyl)propionate hydroxylase
MPRQDVQPALAVGLLSPVLHPARGTIFPQPLLQNKDDQPVHMDEIFPAGWKVIFSKEAGADCLLAAADHHLPHLQVAQLGVGQLVELENVLANWFSKHAVVAAIVRPDHYIYGVCADLKDVTQRLEALRLH